LRSVTLGKALTEFITYDQQLGKIAKEAGLPVLAPGTYPSRADSRS
jgi:hypothetical protein